MEQALSAAPLVLCIDIGSSSLKAGLIDTEGRGRGFTRQVYRRHGRDIRPDTNRPSGGKADFTREVGDWEDALFQALAALAARTPGLPAEAVCVSGNGPTLVPVDYRGDSLMLLQWFDGRQRRRPECPSFFLPKAAWLREEAPELYARTYLFLSCAEWLSWRLGAAPFTSLPAPAYAPFYWDASQLAAFALDSGKFPPFAPMGSVVGAVSPSAARRFHIPQGIPIISGGPDFVMALLGSGAVRPGLVCDRAGSSEGINVCVAAGADGGAPEITGEGESLRLLPHPIPGLWNAGVVIPESGSLFDRYRQETGQDKREYADMLQEIFDHRGRGPAWGVLMTIALNVRRALDTLSLAGFPVTRMTVSGGQAKSAPWNQLKAEITGCAIDIPEIPDGELAGDACAASLALGLASSLSEAVRRIVRLKRSLSPAPLT